MTVDMLHLRAIKGHLEELQRGGEKKGRARRRKEAFSFFLLCGVGRKKSKRVISFLCEREGREFPGVWDFRC